MLISHTFYRTTRLPSLFDFPKLFLLYFSTFLTSFITFHPSSFFLLQSYFYDQYLCLFFQIVVLILSSTLCCSFYPFSILNFWRLYLSNGLVLNVTSILYFWPLVLYYIAAIASCSNFTPNAPPDKISLPSKQAQSKFSSKCKSFTIRKCQNTP